MSEAYNASTIQHIPGYNSAESLKIRLDTESILREVEAHLKGLILVEEYDSDTNRIKVTTKRAGRPLANEEGQHRILMWCRMRINHAVVQGNLKRDSFNVLISQMMQNLNFDMHLNLMRWGIVPTDTRYMCTSIIDMIELFLSRTIDNEERKLFGGVKEQRHETHNKGGIQLGGGKTWQ